MDATPPIRPPGEPTTIPPTITPDAPVPVRLPLGQSWSGRLTISHETTALERVQMGLAAVLLVMLVFFWVRSRAEG